MAIAAPSLSELIDRIQYLEQDNERLTEENAVYREQNERMEVIYEEALKENQGWRARVGGLEAEVRDLKVVIAQNKAKDAQREAAEREREAERNAREAQREAEHNAREAQRDAERAESDARRDAQIALLMARINPIPQPPVLLVPNPEPAARLIAAPQPPVLLVPNPEPAALLPLAPPVQAFDQDDPDPIDDLDFDDFPSPPRAEPLPPPPPAVDNARVLAIVEQWCNSVEQYVKDHGLMPLPSLKRPQGIVIDQEEVAYAAIARVEKTLQQAIAFQEQANKSRSYYKEPPDITLVRRNILNLVPLSSRLCNHFSVMIAVMKVTGCAFTQAGSDVRNKRDAALIALCEAPGIFAEMNLALRDDIDLARLALLRRLSDTDRLRLEALGEISFAQQKSGLRSNIGVPAWNRPASLANASDRLKNLEPFVLEVVQEHPLEISHAGDRCKNNESIGIVAARKSGYALNFLPGLQNNVKVVVTAAATAGAAARKNGDSRGPEYASSETHPQAVAAFNRAKTDSGGCAVM